MSRNGYAKIERGETSLSMERLEQISDLFDMSVIDLMQMDNKSVVYLFSENSDHSSNYYANSDEGLKNKIEKLELMLQHKDELLQQKNKEISTLEKLVEALSNK